MRIDTHQHYWRYNAPDYRWIGPDMQILARDWMPEDFAPMRKQEGIDAVIAVQSRGDEQDTAFLMAQARAHRWIAGVVGWVELRAEDAAERIDYWRDQGPLVGLRHQVQDEPDAQSYLRDRAFNQGVAQVHKAGLVYELLLLDGQMEAAAGFCAAHDAGRLVLDHIGKPDLADGQAALQRWRAHLQPLAAMEHVVAKLSGLVTQTARDAHGQPQEAAITQALDVALEVFGPRRLVFGSDWPVCLLAAPYAQVQRILRDWAQSRLSPHEQQAIFGDNALAVYGEALALPHLEIR